MSCNHHDTCCHNDYCVKRVPIFKDMNEAEIEILQGVTKSYEYKKGDLIFREGEPSDSLFIVNDGLIKMSKVSLDGKEQVVHLLFPGDFFGQTSLLQNQQHFASAEALEPTTVCFIQKSDFRKTLEKNPDMAFRFMLELNDRLSHTEEWMSALSLMVVERRLAKAILLFHQKTKANSSKFKLPVSKKVLASYIGTTPETLSRKLLCLVTDNVIDLNGRREIHIVDKEKLVEMTS